MRLLANTTVCWGEGVTLWDHAWRSKDILLEFVLLFQPLEAVSVLPLSHWVLLTSWFLNLWLILLLLGPQAYLVVILTCRSSLRALGSFFSLNNTIPI